MCVCVCVCVCVFKAKWFWSKGNKSLGFFMDTFFKANKMFVVLGKDLFFLGKNIFGFKAKKNVWVLLGTKVFFKAKQFCFLANLGSFFYSKTLFF